MVLIDAIGRRMVPKKTEGNMKGTGPRRKVNKSEQVKQYLLKRGKITSWEAITKFKATRLSAIILNLRQNGYLITSEWKTNKDGTRYVIYKLDKLAMAKADIQAKMEGWNKLG